VTGFRRTNSQGRLPFNDPVVRNLLTKVKAGKYVMPPFPPDIQNLVECMLTVDPNARISLAQIKQHPAFRIGYGSKAYILPTPLPIPLLVDPIPVESIPEPVLSALRQIGFTDDDELRRDLESAEGSMVKVFYHMLTKNPRDSVPWESSSSPPALPLDVSVMIEGETIIEGDEVQSAPSTKPSSPVSWSLPDERGRWTDVSKSEVTGELTQPYVDIFMPLDELLARIQAMLTELGIQWFHPDDFTVLARKADRSIDLMIMIKQQAAGYFSMDVHVYSATQGALDMVLERIKALLTL